MSRLGDGEQSKDKSKTMPIICVKANCSGDQELTLEQPFTGVSDYSSGDVKAGQTRTVDWLTAAVNNLR